MVQLTITSLIVAFFLFYWRAQLYLWMHPGLMYLAFFVMLGVSIAIGCFKDARRKAPLNYILLGVYTLAMSLMVAFITSMYDAISIMIALAITVVICLSLTIFAFQTKYDFTIYGGVLCCSLVILTMCGLILCFFSVKILSIVYAACGALLFSAYLVYDTQLMIGGRYKVALSPEEYVFAALSLYVDVVEIFLMVLRLVGYARGE